MRIKNNKIEKVAKIVFLILKNNNIQFLILFNIHQQTLKENKINIIQYNLDALNMYVIVYINNIFYITKYIS